MPSSFWLQFAIQEALTLANTFIQLSTLTPAQKTDLQAFITAGEKLATDF